MKSEWKNAVKFTMISIFALFLINIAIPVLSSAQSETIIPVGEQQSRLRPPVNNNLQLSIAQIPSFSMNMAGAKYLHPRFAIAPRTLADPSFNFTLRNPRWLGDINGDGKMDFFIQNTVGNEKTPANFGDTISKTAIFLNSDNTKPYQLLLGKNIYPIFDYNGDGFDDVLDKNTFSIMLGSPGGLTGSISVTNTDDIIRYYRVGDVNNDSRDDLVVISENWDPVTYTWTYEMKLLLGGTTEFVNQRPLENFSEVIFASTIFGSDIDGDDYSEIIIVPMNFYTEIFGIMIFDYSTDSSKIVLADTLDLRIDSYENYMHLSDINGDSFPDLVSAVAQAEGSDLYDIVVYPGIESSPYFSSTPTIITAGYTLDGFSSVGDLNNDGFADFIWMDDDQIITYCLGNSTLTSETTLLGMAVSDDELLTYVAQDFTGDVDGDGFDDFPVNYIKFGSDDRIEKVGSMIIRGEANPSGSSVIYFTQDYENSAEKLGYGNQSANLGDINGDGFDDLGISAYVGMYADLFFGGPGFDTKPDVKIYLPQKGGGYMYCIEGGDINGDGLSDVLVSRGANDPTISKVYIYFGRESWADVLTDQNADVTINCPSSMTRFGYFVRVIRDYNADNVVDFAVGGMDYHAGNFQFKREAYVFFGGSAISSAPDLVLSESEFTQDRWTLLPDYYGYGNTGTEENYIFNAFFAGRISRLGDINDDGYDDFAITDRNNTNTDNTKGRVLVYYGGPGADSQWDLEIPNPGEGYFYGFEMSVNSGDYDGDGYNDIVVGDLYKKFFIFRGGPEIDSLRYYRVDMDYLTFKSFVFVRDFSQAGKYDLIVGQGSLSSRTNALIYQGGEGVDKSAPDLILKAPDQSRGLGDLYKFAYGDFNNNGKIDVVLSQARDSNLGEGTGMVYIYESPIDATPPVYVSQPSASRIDTNSAVIKFSTNEQTTSVLYYNIDSLFDKGTYIEVEESMAKYFHKSLLTGLLLGTKYKFFAEVTDKDGNGPVKSVTGLFITRKQRDIRPPVITSVPTEQKVDTSSAVIIWSTDEPSNSTVKML